MVKPFLKITRKEHIVVSLFYLSSLFLILLVNGALSVSAAEIYVPDDHSTIQNAISAASSGDTIVVRDGDYAENIVVDRSVTIRSENGSSGCTVRGKYSSTVFQITADFVNVSGFTVRDATSSYRYGFYIDGANYCNVSYNNLYNNNIGIRLQSASNNLISGNKINESGRFGLYILSSGYYNEIINNKVDGEPYFHLLNQNDLVIENVVLDNAKIGNLGKISLINCNNITLKNLTLSNNNYGNQTGYGLFLYRTNNSVVESVDTSNNAYAGIYLDDSHHNTIKNTTASFMRNYFGVYLDSSTYNIMLNVRAEHNGDAGIHVRYTGSDNNWIEECTVVNNEGYGLEVYGDNTTIKSCNVSLNGEYDYQGILIGSESCEISGSAINGNKLSGIGLTTGGNVIQNNTVTGNGYCGIEAYGNNFIVSGNKVEDNADYGIYLSGSGSLVYNNLFNNTDNFRVSSSGSNFWNTTETSGTNVIGRNSIGGNAWYYPNGTGYSQICGDIDDDGFCDSPYALNTNNVDFLPLALGGVDTFPPSVVIISPQNQTYLASTTQINVTAHDASGIKEVIAQVDDSINLTLSLSNGIYTGTISLPDGSHWLRIYAEDNSGNDNSTELVYFETTTAVTDCVVISSSGYYHLANNILSNSTKCIVINSSDVIFDGKNYLIEGIDAYNSKGLYAGDSDSSMSNITVRNLNLRKWNHGIHLSNCQNSTLNNNSLINNTYGIYLENSQDIVLRNNTMEGNSYNFEVFSGFKEFDNDIDTSNFVNGKPVYYLVGEKNSVISSTSNAGIVYCIDCYNITIQELTITEQSRAVFFYNTSNSKIRDNVFSDNQYGIFIENSEFNNITGNTVENNGAGIYFSDSDFNRIENNTFFNNDRGIGIYQNSNGNNVLKNNCSKNYMGIGIGEYELDYSCYGNIVYLNYLLNNSINGHDPTAANHWNSTEKMNYEYNGTVYNNYTGNYWDDYTGSDSGEGIGDTPYSVYGGPEGDSAIDYYPMILTFARPPSISNIQNTPPANDSVVITWQTDIVSNNRVLYSTNQNLSAGLWSDWDNSTLMPAISLTGLSGNTTYYFSVFSHNRDDYSLFSNSSILNFTTIRDNKVWTVDDDFSNCPDANFTSIQEAVNSTIDGDTIIVCNGTYVENVIVDRSLNITGIDNPHINANFTGSGFTLKSGGNLIQGFFISNASYYGDNLWGMEAGVRIGYTSYWSAAGVDYHSHLASSNNVVRNNYFTNNGYGVLFVWGSHYNTVSDNIFVNDSLTVLYAKQNNISDNIFLSKGLNTVIKITREVQMLFDDSLFNRIENNNVTRVSSSTLPLILIDDHLNDNSISSNTLIGYGGISISSDGNTVFNNTIRGIEGLPDGDDIGIRINHAEDCIISNNTVELKYKGIFIDTSSPYTHSTNITMRNNRMINNSYHFYLYTPPLVSTLNNAPNFNDFNNDIGESNVVIQDGVEKKIYYLLNTSNQQFDSSDVGFFACINCYNITFSNAILNHNSHGILLYNNTNTIIEDVYLHDNHLAGLSVYKSGNVIVRNSDISNNGEDDAEGIGINFGEVRDSRIENCLVETNWCEGIRLDHSGNNTIIYSNVTDNGPGYYQKPVYRVCDSGKGIRFIQSDGNTVMTNYILGITIPKQNDWTGGQKYGIYMIGDISNNNTIYNNYFNNTVNAIDRKFVSSSEGGYNFWNITKVSGVNIIGGSYLGGNYWHNYTGSDIHGEDGFGDTELPYNSASNIINGGDYLPLTSVGNDTTPPDIFVTSPVEGMTYGANYVYLEVFSEDSDVNSWWYSIDSGSNVTFLPNTIIQNLSNGQHSLKVYVNDSSGNTNFTVINFTVSVSQEGAASAGGGGGGGAYSYIPPVQLPLEEVKEDELDFYITIYSPGVKKYTERSLQLSYSSPVPLMRASFILDDSSPVEIQPSGSITIQKLLLGKHRIKVSGEDYYGRRGMGEVTFEIIPLTFGELESAGTPEFPEELAFSFMGRDTGYKLTFEAKVDGKLDVYLNKYLVKIRENRTLSDYTGEGEFIASVKNSEWTFYEFEVNGTPDAENLITFVTLNSTQNPEWQVRNVNLIPAISTDFPMIEVFSKDRALSSGEELSIYVRIDGIANVEDANISGYIYLISPDGKTIYYPDWKGEQSIDSYYLKHNYFGRLPSALKFTDGFVPGTYTIVGKIMQNNSLISLSTEKIYFSNKTSTKLFVNRETASEGKEVVIEYALTKSPEKMNGTLIISLEHPDGETIYLPMLSDRTEGTEYEPIRSEFSTVFKGVVDNSWENGTYVVRSALYDDSGELIAEDMQIFDVCREEGGVEGKFLTGSSSNIIFSRIVLIDATNLDTVRKEVTGNQYSFSINATPGRYYLMGEAFSDDGGVYSIPLTPVSMKCGQRITRNVILEYHGIALSEQEMSEMFPQNNFYRLAQASYIPDSIKMDNFKHISFESSEGCSKPRVFFMADILNRTDPLALKYLERIRKSSSGIEIYFYGNIRDVLVEQEKFLIENPAAEIDLSKINQMINAEYMLRFSHSTFGSKILMNSVIIDLDSFQDVGGYSVSGDSEDTVLNSLISSQGDIGATIRAWEMTHLPPRDPIISITLNPFSVAPEEGKNELRITASVTDCKGNPVEGTYVYFDEITERGYVKAENSGDGYVSSRTDSDGNSGATYVLNRGFNSGTDTVDIFTKGRGKKNVHTKAVIKITGIGIEIYADKEEIFPKESTLLHVYLYTDDENGRKPLSGKMVLVEKYALMDSKIAVLGETFEDTSNPVTDEDGRATLKLTAGKKEGIVKIPVRYQALSYEDSVWDAAIVKVKKDEFVIILKWNENMDWNKISGYAPPGWTHEFFESGTYNYNLISKTIWNRQNDREKTSATLYFKRNSDWNSKDTYCSCLCTEWGSSNGYQTCEKAIPYCDTWTNVGTTDSNINSKITGVETVHTKLKTDNSGNLWVYINPVKLKMPLKGSYTSEGDWSFGRTTDPYCECAGFGLICTYPAGVNPPQIRTIDSDSGTESSDFNYNGKIYYPYPEYNADCILVKGTGARGIGNCYYFPEEFPRNYVKLQKTGESSYRAYHYSYADKVEYTSSGFGTNALKYDISRTFDIAVVRR